MASCVVTWCKKRKGWKAETGISYHTFPKNEITRLKWIKAVCCERREQDWMPSKGSRVCSIHFDDEDIYISNKGNCMLKKSAVPICTMVRRISNYTEGILTTRSLDQGGSKLQVEMVPPELQHSEQCFLTTETVNSNKNIQLPDQTNSSSFKQDLDYFSLPTNSLYSEENKTSIMDIEHENTRVLDQPGELDFPSYRPHKHKIMIKCPNCTYTFDADSEQDKENYPPEKKQKLQHILSPVDITVQPGSPINISSSEIESVFNTPKTHMLKQKLKQKTFLAKKRLSKIKNLQRKNKRLELKNKNLKDILANLKRQGFHESNMHMALEEFPNDLFCNLKKKKNKNSRTVLKYTKTVKKFALTLNYYSPSAYKCVRRKLNNCLPHPSTLSKWYQVVDGKPGFTEEAFRALKSKFIQTTGQNLICLMADEMAIRQQKIFNGKEFDGLVTYGPSDEIATQVYVIMLVSLNDSFKLPLGYFFINGLGAEQRSNLINICLKKCHEAGAEVVSLTFDGCPSNFAMAKHLGCNFDNTQNMTTHFPHPITGLPVVIFLDPCHMLKLIRNNFEAKQTIIDSSDGLIKWKYLMDLKKLQDDIGLHMGNKLTGRHLSFRNNIMNVKLATQTLSNSVAAALKLCCKELKIPDFENALPTINFIEIINNLFDVLNCRSVQGKGYKHPVFVNKKDELVTFLEQVRKYLLGLKIEVQTKTSKTVQGKKQFQCTTVQKLLTETKSKTGFIGLLICINSFKMLFESLAVQREVVKYILPYKFSQDHLELFFGVIRNHGRCNNNPNARQFMGLYKKTLLNLELSSKFTGNCIPLEEFPILNCSSVINRTTPGYRYEFEEGQNVNIVQTTENNNCIIMSQMLDNRQLPEIMDQIIGYVAGFVARKLSVKIRCSDCTTLLFATEKLYFHKLICLKDFGGLSYPSVILFKICHNSETILRQTIKMNTEGKNLNRNCNLALILSKCFIRIVERLDIFNDIKNKHSSGESNHETLLIKGVIEEYLKTRLHYIAKNDSLINSNRQKLNKLIIFRGM